MVTNNAHNWCKTPLLLPTHPGRVVSEALLLYQTNTLARYGRSVYLASASSVLFASIVPS